MNSDRGYYNGMNVDTTDPEQVKRAVKKADEYNAYIKKKYGNSTNPKAIDRLNTLRNDVEITPQYQVGGKLKFLQPTDEHLPEGYVIPNSTPSSELAMSIGGENGEPAYLIPSFKYGRPLDDPMGEFRKTGEHLGGPFKTWQEADEWERTVRHPAVERKENIMFPQEKFAMGGSIPGAVGFTYAREGAPSKGPRRNQTDVTDASAQNGKNINPYNYPEPDHYSRMNPFIFQDPQSRIIIGGVNPTYSTKDFSIGASAVGVGNKDFIKAPVDYGVRGSYHPTENFSINANLSNNNIGGGFNYRFENGGEMSYYQHGLDWKPKGMENGGWFDNYQGEVIKDDKGQWAHPGKVTEIGSNNITMQGVPYDVLGISDEGDTKLMKPGKNYKFKGKKVTEFPMAKNGVNQQDQKTLQHLDQLTNFTNYNKPQPGGWLNKYN